MTSPAPTPGAVPPIPGGAAAGVVPDIASFLREVDAEDTGAQIHALDQSLKQLRHALDATRQ